jgi:hypothetical protein
MPRETAVQKRTRISNLLADYANRNADLSKLTKIVAGLKEQVKEIDAGTYGDWALSFAAPRVIADQAAVTRGYAERGETIPTKLTNPSAVVTPVTK